MDDIPLPDDSESKSESQSRLNPKFGVDREWDRGKGGYERWITKERKERKDDFRPPSFYYSKK